MTTHYGGAETMSATGKERRESFCGSWDGLPLDSARTAFRWLVTGPHPLGVNGCRFEGVPNRHVPLDELRDWLMQAQVPGEVRDAIWSSLVQRSRNEGGAWTVACVGLALPALVAHARWLGQRFRGEREDIQAAVLTGFLHALATIDLAETGVMPRLVWRAWGAGKAALAESLDAPRPVDMHAVHASPSRPRSGHPDLVLARAVAEEVLTAAEAELISETRLGGVAMSEWTRARGVALKTGFKARDRAEDRLVTWLRDQGSDQTFDDPVGDAAVSEASLTGKPADLIPRQEQAVSGRRRNGRPSTSRKSSPTSPSEQPRSASGQDPEVH
jgi:hypothetical protein